MKYTFELYKEDGSPRKWAGTFCPPRNEAIVKHIKENPYEVYWFEGKFQDAYSIGRYDDNLYEEEE